MSKFQVGQKVKCINDLNSVYRLTKGNIYTIQRLGDADNFQVEEAPGIFWDPTRFEALKEKWKSLTRGGYEFKIYTEEALGRFPIIGEVLINNVWQLARWRDNGENGIGAWNLVKEVPTPDYDQFYQTVFGASRSTPEGALYERARQWFIDHPEELKQ